MNNLYTLLALSAVSACNARNAFDAVVDRMKTVEHQLVQMLPHKFKLEDVKFTDFSIKNGDAYVTLIFKTRGIEKHNVSVKANRGTADIIIPTKKGQTIIHIATDENGKKFVEVISKQEVIHEIKDMTGEILASHSDTLEHGRGEKHVLPSNIDVMHLNPEVSDEYVTVILPKEEAKKIPVVIV